jgi:hypothetical protein
MRIAPLFVLAGALLAGMSLAKLPPLSDEAKAKASEAAAKTGWSDKVANFQLCKSQDKAAANYRATMKQSGKEAQPAASAAAACTDPGPYVSAASAPAAPAALPAASAPKKS